MVGELVTAFNLERWNKFRHHLSIFEELKTWQYHFTLWVTLNAKVILTVAATQSAMRLATLLNNNSNYFFLFFLKYEH
jgi:hypothetical protein